MSLKEQINLDKLPKHIAVIMDGNGRWAKQQGQERRFGHESGVEAVRNTVEACAEIGVQYLTLYAFSTENWNRPKEEVDALMQILVKSISHERETFRKNNIRLHAIGNIDSLPADCYQELQEAIAFTKDNTRLNLVLALSYSSRWEITHAVNKLLKANLKEEVTEEIFSSYLTTAGMPDPELLIRTSGEERISNFLLWQIAYAELYFTKTLWPDFQKEDLYQAIVNFQQRERRFGLTSEQLNS